MKKGVILSLILIILAFLGFSFLPQINNVNSYEENKFSWAEFESEYQQLIKDDDYSKVFIEKDASINEVLSVISEEIGETNLFTNEITASDFNKNVLLNNEFSTSIDIADICESLDFTVNVYNDGYKIYPKYKLKRIIAMGKVTNTYGAVKILTFDDYNILAYSTEEETKYAYEQLLKDKNLTICVDSIEEANDYDYSGYVNQWGAKAIDLGYYSEYLQDNNCNQEIVVAVFDTGINTNHVMLKDRILKDENGNLVGYASVNSTYSGYVFEDDGWGDADKDGVVDTPTGHGSHVSGIIAGLTPSNVKILPVKVLGHNGSGARAGILNAAKAIYNDNAINKYNIVCVNFSLGATYSKESDADAANAVYKIHFDEMLKNSIVPVVSAGNKAADAKFQSPAGCDSAVTVGACYGPNVYGYNPNLNNQNYNGTYYLDPNYSNFGDDVDIVAPGTYIRSASIGYSTNSANGAGLWMTGTSQAAPHVSAAVALLCADKSYYNNGVKAYDSNIIKTRLFNNCTKEFDKSGRSLDYCYGMVSLKYFNGNINCEVTDTEVDYNGEYHTVNVTVTGVDDFSISYGFSAYDCNITDITTNINFKNSVISKQVFVKITAFGHKDTIKSAYLTINKADLYISTGTQSFIYGDEIILNNNYAIDSGQIYSGDSVNILLSTDAKAGDNVGDYAIEASCSNKNYNIIVNSGICKIEKRDLYVTGNIYGTYGEDPVITAQKCNITNNVDDLSELSLTFSCNADKFSAVNSYKVSVSCTNSNYNLEDDLTYVINKRNITILVGDKEVIYGENIEVGKADATISSGEIVNNDNINLTVATSAVKGSTVGEYDIVAQARNDNYNITIQKGKLNIIKRTLIVSGAMSGVYGNEPNISLDNCSIINSVDSISSLNLSLSHNVDRYSEVKSYDVIVNCGNPNYDVESSVIYVVTKRNLTISATTQEFTYGDEIVFDNSKFEIVSGEIVNNDNINLSLSTTAVQGSSVGEYEIVGEANNINYNITVQNGKVVITKRVLTITGSLSSEYGNDVVIDLSKCQISNSVNDIEDLLLTATTTADSSSSIGRYDVVVSCGNSNYILSQHVIYKIEPKHITIKADTQEFEYGEEIVLDLYKYTIEESYNQDEITVSLSLNESLIGSFVGTFPNAIVVNCVSSDNYVVGTIKGSIKIIPRNIEVSINDYETDVVYGDEVDSEKFSYNVTNGSVVNGDNLNLNLLTNASSTSNVGKYNIVGKNNNSNYNVSFVKAGLINIVKRPLMINVKMHSIYGEFINLKDFTYTIVSGRIANDDELNIVLETTATQNSSVGLYNLTIVNCNNNYIITLDDLSFYTIEQRPITITSVQYSEYGNNHVIDSDNYYVSAGRILEGDNLNIKLNLLISSTASIGEYKINVEHSNNNYTINSNAKLVITARKLKIKIDDVEKVYGNNVSLNNSKYEILQGSVVAGDNLNIELSSKATSKSNVGNYAITGKAKNKNYSVEFINGNLKINKCKVTINLLDQSVKHGNYIDLDQTAFTIVKGEVENKEDLKIRIYANATSYSNVGSYEIFAESSNNNYEISYNNATLTIKNSVLDYCFIIGCASVSVLTLAGIAVLIVKKVKNKRLYNEIINRLK